MKDIKISIAEDFSDAPGARYLSDGPDSGEEFFEKLLSPRFQEATHRGKKLVVDMDGTFGYATSFLSEAFGKLSKTYGKECVLSTLVLISDEDPELISFTLKSIKDC